MARTDALAFPTPAIISSQSAVTAFDAITGTGALWRREPEYKTLNGGDVATWTATDGTSLWDESTASKQPVNATRDGLPELDFDGANHVMPLSGLTTSGWTESTVAIKCHLDAYATTNQRILANNAGTPYKLSYRYSAGDGFIELTLGGSTLESERFVINENQYLGIIAGVGASGAFLAVWGGGYEWDVYEDTGITAVAPASPFLGGQSTAAPSFNGGVGFVAMKNRNVFDTTSEFLTMCRITEEG